MDQESLSNVDPVFYKAKKILFEGRYVHIIYQPNNGVSFLLALCNSLLLKGVIQLGLKLGDNIISEQQMIEIIYLYIKTKKRRINKTSTKERISRLGKSIEFDIKFLCNDAINPTDENSLFELMDVKVYHGFLVDPEDVNLTMALGANTYGNIKRGLAVHHMKKSSCSGSTTQSSCDDNDLSYLSDLEWKLIEAFLDDCPNGLTCHGLLSLKKELQEKEVAVFLCNGNFHTVLKGNGLLYLLQNDIAYYSMDVAWKLFENVDDNESFLTSKFEMYVPQQIVMRPVSHYYPPKTIEGNLTFRQASALFGRYRPFLYFHDFPSLLLAQANSTLIQSKLTFKHFDWEVESSAIVDILVSAMIALRDANRDAYPELDMDIDDLKNFVKGFAGPVNMSVSFKSIKLMKTGSKANLLSCFGNIFHCFVVGPEHGKVAALLESKFYDEIISESGASQFAAVERELIDNFLKKHDTHMTSYG